MLNLKRSHDKKYTQDLLLGRAFSYTGRAIKEQSWTLNVNTNGPPRAQTQERDKDLFSAGVNISLQHSFFFHYSTYHNLVYCFTIYYLPSHQMIHIFLALLPMRDRFVHAVRDNSVLVFYTTYYYAEVKYKQKSYAVRI